MRSGTASGRSEADRRPTAAKESEERLALLSFSGAARPVIV